MTQFLSLRQVFENFLTYQDLFIHLLAALVWSQQKPHFCAAKPSTIAQLFCVQQAFEAILKFHASPARIMGAWLYSHS